MFLIYSYYLYRITSVAPWLALCDVELAVRFDATKAAVFLAIGTQDRLQKNIDHKSSFFNLLSGSTKIILFLCQSQVYNTVQIHTDEGANFQCI